MTSYGDAWRAFEGAPEDPSSRSFDAAVLEVLRDSLKDITVGISKNLSLVLLLMGLNELLNRAAIDKVSIGGFELTKLPFVSAILPVVISYIFYDLAARHAAEHNVAAAYSKCISRVYPSIRQSVILMEPWRTSLTGYSGGGVSKLLGDALGRIVLFGIPLYEVYAYVMLFKTSGRGIVIWGSLLLSCFFLVYGIVVWSEEEEQPMSIFKRRRRASA
jgi:hypothetical protein